MCILAPQLFDNALSNLETWKSLRLLNRHSERDCKQILSNGQWSEQLCSKGHETCVVSTIQWAWILEQWSYSELFCCQHLSPQRWILKFGGGLSKLQIGEVFYCMHKYKTYKTCLDASHCKWIPNLQAPWKRCLMWWQYGGILFGTLEGNTTPNRNCVCHTQWPP